MNTDEKNVNEEVLKDVSGGLPIGNNTHRDENGVENKVPSSPFGVNPEHGIKLEPRK